MKEPLDQLLEDADASTSLSPATHDLPARVRRRRIRQNRTMRIAQTSAGAAIIAIGCLVISHPYMTATRQIAIDPVHTSSSGRAEQAPRLNGAIANEAFSPELASLDLTAELHERIADDLMAHRKTRQHPATDPAHDPTLAMLQQQRDQAALLLVYEADQYRKQKQPREAIAVYQKAIELFPQSHWANIARQRMKEIL
jgi:tetratricopeptide (TPR) repeat protein